MYVYDSVITIYPSYLSTDILQTAGHQLPSVKNVYRSVSITILASVSPANVKQNIS